MPMLIPWIHLLSLTIFLGALLGLWILVLSPLTIINNAKDKLAFLACNLKVYNPLQIGALGLMLLTGAFKITDLKEIHGIQYASELGATLGLKLSAAFVIILLTTYQTMGLAHRFVKRAELADPISDHDLGKFIRRLQGSTYVILILAFVTVLVSIKL